MRRGDVYWADLTPRSGSEQDGRRPVIVVSDDGFNSSRGWRSLIVVPVSTGRQLVTVPSIVPLGGALGLDDASVAVCHQVTTIDRAKLEHRLGALTSSLLLEVDDGLRAGLGL